MECYSAINRNEGPIYATTWKHLEDVILSEEVSQKEPTHSMIPFT